MEDRFKGGEIVMVRSLYDTPSGNQSDVRAMFVRYAAHDSDNRRVVVRIDGQTYVFPEDKIMKIKEKSNGEKN